MKANILVVDDEKSIRYTLGHFLSEEGYDVSMAADYDEAVTAISDRFFDLIITDIVLGGMSGINFLEEVSKRNLGCPVVMITGAPDVNTATDALRLGAFDYIPKPVKKESLLHVARMALKHKELKDEKEKYRQHLESIFNNINEGIITVDREGVITDINEAAKRICGFSDGSLGKVFYSNPPSCDKKCVELLRETLAQGKPVEMDRIECRQLHERKVVTANTSLFRDLKGTLSGAMLVIRDETRIDTLERDLKERMQCHNIIGKSDKMQKIYNLIDDLASVNSTVLIQGESGTGKELVAEALHYRGNRSGKPLIRVNCSALQESLLESELFGHVKGAFTGAAENKEGRFKKADGGTIFLDEIGDISPLIQVKLLRVLQNREFERVGDSTPIRVNVRVVAATHQDLRSKVTSGSFREDLYYRLKVVEIALPPLRKNREDTPLLVDHFIQKYNKQFNREIEAVSDNVMKLFMEYPWPGNVRELEHALEHAFVICHKRVIMIDDLPKEFTEIAELVPDSHKEEQLDDAHVLVQALDKSGWNISRAARLLGMSRPTIYRKMKQCGITGGQGTDTP